jgi:hypothetical protein
MVLESFSFQSNFQSSGTTENEGNWGTVSISKRNKSPKAKALSIAKIKYLKLQKN